MKYNPTHLLPVAGVIIFAMGLPLIYADKWSYTMGEGYMNHEELALEQADLMNYGLWACVSGVLLVNAAAIAGVTEKIRRLEKPSGEPAVHTEAVRAEDEEKGDPA